MEGRRLKAGVIALLLSLTAFAQLKTPSQGVLTLSWDQPDCTPDTVFYIYGTDAVLTYTNYPDPLNGPFRVAATFTNWVVDLVIPATNLLSPYHPKVPIEIIGTNRFFVVTASNMTGESFFSQAAQVPQIKQRGTNLHAELQPHP